MPTAEHQKNADHFSRHTLLLSDEVFVGKEDLLARATIATAFRTFLT